MAGLQAITDANPARPFRFFYMSAWAVNEDEMKSPRYMPEYMKMRVSYAFSYSGPDTQILTKGNAV